MLRLHAPTHHIAMATAASQPYIAKLGFSDPDRSKDRHGLACEYLFERLLELEVRPYANSKQRDYLERLYKTSETYQTEIAELLEENRQNGIRWRGSVYSQEGLRYEMQAALDRCAKAKTALEDMPAYLASDAVTGLYSKTECISAPITTGYQGKQTAGFADVLFRRHEIKPLVKRNDYSISGTEIRTQCILGEVKITKQAAETVLQQINYYRQHIADSVDKVYILVDYECGDLQRLTKDSDIHVYRLGERFEQWISQRQMPAVEEL